MSPDEPEIKTWRCYHCDEVFDHDCDARHHFGMDQSADPACKIKAGAEMSLVQALRRAERELADAWAAIHDETTEAAKAYHAQQTRHREQLAAAEELGYERGLADASWPRERLRELVDVVATWAHEEPCLLDPVSADKLIEQVPAKARQSIQPAGRAIMAERRRQIDAEGWSPEHDDEHKDGSLARAAASYAVGGGLFTVSALQVPLQVWPYRWDWNPKDPRTNLIRAGALIIAEIERLDRAKARRAVIDADEADAAFGGS